MSRRFPILQRHDRDETGHVVAMEPRSVPWEMIEPHREQAERNHCGQTLEKLASRGGLCPTELWCAVHGRDCSPIHTGEITEQRATVWLRDLLGESGPTESRDDD